MNQIISSSLNKLCKDNNLSDGSMHDVIIEKRKHYKGWQVRRNDDPRPFYDIKDLKIRHKKTITQDIVF